MDALTTEGFTLLYDLGLLCFLVDLSVPSQLLTAVDTIARSSLLPPVVA